MTKLRILAQHGENKWDESDIKSWAAHEGIDAELMSYFPQADGSVYFILDYGTEKCLYYMGTDVSTPNAVGWTDGFFNNPEFIKDMAGDTPLERMINYVDPRMLKTSHV